MGLKERIISSRPAMIAIAIVVVLLALMLFDTAANWGKAYGNVTINGIEVGGMNADEIKETLNEAYGQRISHAQVTVYANEESTNEEPSDELVEEEQVAIAEQISAEEAAAQVGKWQVDSLSLRADIPYDEIAEQAIAVGRSDGGILARLGLTFQPRDITMSLEFGDEELETLASEIDNTIGDPRVDTTVQIEDGKAVAVEGHAGTLVDRDWLKDQISQAMLYGGEFTDIVAEASIAESRISFDEAQQVADSINRALSTGAAFNYGGKNWRVGANELGDWTKVEIVPDGDSWKLETSIDSSRAIPAVISGSGAYITSDDMVVRFENNDGYITVHTEGSGVIPEVKPAVDELNEALYGQNGTAWNSGQDAPVIEITESDRPESMSFDEALDLGIICVVGEYTTEFSNLEGTENRNHNIKLAADILNNGIIEANGGTWDFNDRSGDTNADAGFWEAGSIVDGEYVDSVGGGICQVATTIFNAAYEGGFTILERHNHSLYIASYPTGRDAAVDYPTSSLKFENDLPSDVLLKISYTDTTITAQLYSVYTGTTVTTETSEWEEGEEYGTRFEVDDSIGSTNYYRKSVGSDGSRVTVTRTITHADGTEDVDVFESIYSAKDEVYVVGSEVDRSALIS